MSLPDLIGQNVTRKQSQCSLADSGLQKTNPSGDTLPKGFKASDPDANEKCTPESRFPPLMAYTYLMILTGSICGVLARKGLVLLTTYNGSFLEGVVWANFVACLVMGMATESGKTWTGLLNSTQPLYASKAAVPLYAGITTGFCGSCSSFSSFILEAFSKGANLPPDTADYPNVGYGVLGVIQVLVTHIAVSIGGFRAGTHLTRGIERYNFSFRPHAYGTLETTIVLLGIGMYIAIIVLIATKSDGAWRSWTFACLFAPWGAFVRFLLSRLLNLRLPNFPLGTFVANLSGTMLLATFTLLSLGRLNMSSELPIVSNVLNCHVLVGLADGFCGCLTTVSTFIVEICALQISSGYIYGLVSVWTSFVAMLLILGSYNWSVGLTYPVC